VLVTGGVVNATSRLVGIIGWPVSHSLSPAMHNAAFAAAGLDWAYVPLPVEPDRVEAAVRGLVALGFAGANVTIPHKTAVLRWCDELDDVARKAASVNTLVVRDGRVNGSSTDGLAVTGAVDAAGGHVLMLGAGGAAQAVAVALLDAGATRVTVAARRREGAQHLAEHLRSAVPGATVDVAEAWPPTVPEATIVVNGTPLKDELAISPLPHQQVVDLAYLPDRRETALVRAARERGCPRVVDGLEVLVRQGAASFERWTGLEAPVEVMRAAARGER
jgi:shikimate dehydrogenase